MTKLVKADVMTLVYSTWHTSNSLKIASVSEQNCFIGFLFKIEDVGHSLSVSVSHIHTQFLLIILGSLLV